MHSHPYLYIEKSIIKQGHSKLPVKDTETIVFGKVEAFCLILILKNLKKRLFDIVILITNIFWMFIVSNIFSTAGMTILENAYIKYLQWSLFSSRSLQLYYKMDSITDAL